MSTPYDHHNPTAAQPANQPRQPSHAGEQGVPPSEQNQPGHASQPGQHHDDSHASQPARSWAAWTAPASEGHYQTPGYGPAPTPGGVPTAGPAGEYHASGDTSSGGYYATGDTSSGGYYATGDTSSGGAGYGAVPGYGHSATAAPYPGSTGSHYPGGASSAAHPHGQPAPSKPRRSRTPWLAVGAAALLSAGLASGGTAAILQAQGDPGAQQQSSSTNAADQSAPIQTAADSGPDWEAVAETVRPGVVSIEVASQGGAGAGSGMIWDDQGHIVTNNHVIDGAQQIVVTLNDGRMFEAQAIGTDPMTDLAVLELVDPPDDLQLASMGSAEDLEVGRPVMAVGNPLGLSSTVTTGIISALDRPVTAGEGGQAASVTNAIQIDAAINPGNSGGPLFDAEGQVIGITSSIAALSGGQSGSIGLGFAIPADLVTNIVEQLVENGEAEHAFLGVTLSADTVTVDGATRSGAAVHSVQPGSPAADADLAEGDVITAIDDRPTSGPEALTGYVRAHTAGDEVQLTIVRDGEEVQEQVTLATTAEQIA